jgi:hypothetical protein
MAAAAGFSPASPAIRRGREKQVATAPGIAL